jgi:hypothetical protein
VPEPSRCWAGVEDQTVSRCGRPSKCWIPRPSLVAAAGRPLPGAFPAGAPCHNVGTDRALHCGKCGPNIVKGGTPQKALSSACCSRRLADTRGALSPGRFPRVPPVTMLGPIELSTAVGAPPTL